MGIPDHSASAYTIGSARDSGVRRTPGVGKALSFLKALPELSERPSIKALACLADVSYATMWKAIHRHENRDKRTDQVPADASPHEPIIEPRQSWQRLKLRIEKDLIQGHLRREPALPQVKELCVRYGVGFRTMRKALAHLTAQDVLRSVGHGYQVVVRSPGAGSLRIAVLLYAWYQGSLMLTAQYDQEFMSSLDQQCSQRRISTEVLRYHFGSNYRAVVTDVEGIKEQNLAYRKDLDGCILLVSGSLGITADLFSQLHAMGKPIVIVDEIGGWEIPEILLQGGRTLHLRARPFETAARCVTSALIAEGHRHFAFLSVFHGDVSSQQCLMGIKAAVKIAGQGHSCKELLVHGTEASNEFTISGRARYSDAPLRDAYARWKRSAPRAFGAQLDQFFSDRLEQQIWYAEVRHQLWPMFEKAFVDESIACWLVPDCNIAFIAHEYLARKKPRISLIAFGNSLEMVSRRISMYDFNCAAAVTASIRHIVAPTCQFPGQKGHTLQIEGMLTIRESPQRV